MDQRTLNYYDTHARELATRYDAVTSPMSPYLAVSFPAGARVLDVGAGSGRDLAALLDHGYDAWGVEPSEGLRAAAAVNHPALAGRLVPGTLPNIGTPFGGQFDGILCSAVLMHLADADLFDAVLALRALLKQHGRVLISLPSARTDVGPDARDSHGRLFKPYAAEEIQLLFERLGFQLLGRWDTQDALQRAGTHWYTLLLELRSGGPARAADQIEGVLNRDRKVATYKFALFRALAEIAMQEPRAATWLPDGRVGVALDRIAARWLTYYWPIFASDRFIPQSQAEGAGSSTQPVALRAPVMALMEAFRAQGAHGGLTAWHLTCSSQPLTGDLARLHAAALGAIARAIRTGPVAFAGGALETGPLFEYDAATKRVVMSAEIWRELCLLGHWIVDAVVVRWAKLTERFSQRQGLTAGDVLPLLLAKPEAERATALAREVYTAAAVDRCVWSGRPLTNRRFAVDHVIPFSMWGNNDLWNLLPTHPVVNGHKSDKLPSAAVLMAQQGPVLENWRLLRDALPTAFDRQAETLLGERIRPGQGWATDLFGRLREAIELTATQRGVERWSP